MHVTKLIHVEAYIMTPKPEMWTFQRKIGRFSKF